MKRARTTKATTFDEGETTMTTDNASDFYAIYFDETDGWTIAPEDAPYVEKILGVYVYDASTHTHLCEITPSYWLAHAYDTVVLRYTDDLTDEIRERIYDRYECGQWSDDTYMHVRSIERIDPSRKHSYGSFDGETFEERYEQAREQACCNCPF